MSLMGKEKAISGLMCVDAFALDNKSDVTELAAF